VTSSATAFTAIWSGPGLIVPLTVMVIALPAPTLIEAPVNDIALPLDAFEPQAAAPVATQLTLTPPIIGGTRSSTVNDGACDGPKLVTVIV
jgi:hypothetical protein